MLKMKIKRRFYRLFSLFYRSFGYHTVIYKPLFIRGRKYISLSKNITFRENARIECIKKWNNLLYSPNLCIGENTSFEQSAHIICAGELYIGKNCVFSSRVFISNANHLYDKISLSVLDQGLKVKDIKIGNYCFVGMDVKIFPGVNIGDNVIIGANSIVCSDLPSYTVCVGNPARPIKKYNFEKQIWEKVG